MPRTRTIARLTVDRPQMGWDVGCTIPVWLRSIASQVENPNAMEETRSPRSLALKRHYFGPHAADARNVHVVNLHIPAFAALSLATRKRVSKWLRSRATWVEKHGALHDRRWFTQEFSL